METALILIAIVLIAHACKPALKRRAAVVDGRAAGVLSALAFTVLSVVQLSATLLAIWALIVWGF